jgi:hypothetical protein
MGYYIIIFLSALIFSLGLLLLKKPFFSFAKSTTGLLNVMLESKIDEDQRQKQLIQRLGKLLGVMGVFLLFFSLITIIALLPLIIFLQLTPSSLESIDTDSWKFYISMILGSLILFFEPVNKKKKKNYTGWSALLHAMVLDNYNISRSLFQLERRLYRKKVANSNPAFLIVTGLARAGTTALTNRLFETGRFHSLSYANMPFLLSINLWKKFYRPSGQKQKERAHGDQVMHGYRSIEALEEYFFKTCTNDSYLQDNHLLKHEIDQETYRDYLDYQNLLKEKGSDTVYLAKNNNLMLRYESMRSYNQEFMVILLFRNPADHAYSLMKQHRRFCEMQDEDAFVLEYMNWLGHHEFGLNQKRFCFNKDNSKKEYFDKADVNYWISVWIDYYRYFLNLPEDPNLAMVDYHDFLKQPVQLIQALGNKFHLNLKIDQEESFSKQPYEVKGIDPSLKEEALKIYLKLKDRKFNIQQTIVRTTNQVNS